MTSTSQIKQISSIYKLRENKQQQTNSKLVSQPFHVTSQISLLRKYSSGFNIYKPVQSI